MLMVYYLAMLTILEPIVCSIWKLTESWRLARYPLTVFECAGDEEMAETLFVEEEDEEGEENVDHVHDRE